MKRDKLKNILQKYTESPSTVTSWLNGNRRPTYDVLYKLNEEFNIPFNVWKDIKSFITDNSISNQSTKSTTQKEKGVA